jgi:hypothetical protein
MLCVSRTDNDIGTTQINKICLFRKEYSESSLTYPFYEWTWVLISFVSHCVQQFYLKSIAAGTSELVPLLGHEENPPETNRKLPRSCDRCAVAVTANCIVMSIAFSTKSARSPRVSQSSKITPFFDFISAWVQNVCMTVSVFIKPAFETTSFTKAEVCASTALPCLMFPGFSLEETVPWIESKHLYHTWAG